MSPRPVKRRSVVLLLAFVLGGIATPLAHELVHLLDGPRGVTAAETAVTDFAGAEHSHDCELCEVRLAAVETAFTERALHVAISLDARPVPGLAPATPLRAFDGRAPPAVM